jgi:hypothetical protein
MKAEEVFFFTNIDIYSIEMNRIYGGGSTSHQLGNIKLPFSHSGVNRFSMVQKDFVKSDFGTIVVTNKRIMILGTKKFYGLDYKKMKNIEVSNKTKLYIRVGSRVSPFLFDIKNKKKVVPLLSYINAAKEQSDAKK